MRMKAVFGGSFLLRFLRWAGVLGMVVGCTTLELGPYSVQPPARYDIGQTQDGITIVAQPILDGGEVEKYFGTDFTSAGIVPVFLTVENRNTSSSVMVFKEKIQLHAGLSSDAEVPDKVAPEGKLRVLTIAGTVLLSYPLIWAALKAGSDKTVINHNFQAREFHTRTLSPGQTANGFVYFKLPEAIKLPDRWAVDITTLEAKSKQATRFRFEFDTKGRRYGS